MTRKNGVEGLERCACSIHRTFCLVFAFLPLICGGGELLAASKASLPPQITGFITNKEIQARALARQLDLKVSDDVWAFFRTAQTGSAASITNTFERLKTAPASMKVPGTIQPWGPLSGRR